jgi:uncharacterized membrane protein
MQFTGRISNKITRLSKHPKLVDLTILFLLVNSILWVTFGLYIALGFHPAIPDNEMVKWIMVVLSIVCGILFAGSMFFLLRHNNFAFYFVCVQLCAILVLTITDQIGISDLIVFLFTLATLINLIANRKWFCDQSIKI